MLCWTWGCMKLRDMQAFRRKRVYKLPNLSGSNRHNHWSQTVADWLRSQVKKICKEKVRLCYTVKHMTQYASIEKQSIETLPEETQLF